MSDHLVFGLVVRSDRPLPGIALTDAVGDPDITIVLGEAPPWEDAPPGDVEVIHESESDDERGPALVASRESARAWRGGVTPPLLRLEFAEGITFWCTLDGRRLWARWVPPLTFDDAMTFLVGPGLGYALRARGVLALHASAVAIDGRAIGFVGPGGAGKSTLAAALGRRGHAVLTDDVLALRPEGRHWQAQPAVPHLKVWSDSARLLLGEQGARRLAPLTPTWPKHELALGEHDITFRDTAAPLAGLLIVGERSAGPPRATIAPVSGRDAILALVGNTYTNYLLDRAQRGAELTALARLVKDVRIARVFAGEGSADLELTCAAIERWAR